LPPKPNKGACRALGLPSLKPDWKGDWQRYAVPLAAFDWKAKDGEAFGGCGDAISAADVDQVRFVLCCGVCWLFCANSTLSHTPPPLPKKNKIEFKNSGGGERWLCIDQVKVY
jgi:hypothetical protein